MYIYINIFQCLFFYLSIFVLSTRNEFFREGILARLPYNMNLF